MTTIAYRDGVMAADSGVWNSNIGYRTAIKIAVGPDGSLHGVTGSAGDALSYLRWVESGMDGSIPKPEVTNREEGRSAFNALVVPPTGDIIRIWTAFGWEDHHAAAFFALGAGSEIAVGAMAAGASAERAIEIVAEHSAYALLPVRTIRRGRKLEVVA